MHEGITFLKALYVEETDTYSIERAIMNISDTGYENVPTGFDNNTSVWANITHKGIARQTPEFPKYIQITASVFYTFIFLIGILGNILVVTVVCMNRNMKTSLNMHLVNLCVADLLALIVCMPTALVDVYAKDVWYFGETMCKAVPFLENTVAHTSVLTLIAISVERYRVVCKPLSGISDNVLKSARVVPGLWLMSALSSIPYIYIARFKDSRHIDGTPIKVCRMPMTRPWHKVYVSILFSYYFVIPFLVLLVLYCRICYKLHIATNARSQATQNQHPSHYRRRRRLKLQVVNIIFCLVLLFFIFHLPFRVISMWMTFAKKEQIHGLGLERYFNILYTGRIMFYLNHAVNPIIYNFVSTKFRSALMSLIIGRRGHGSFMSSNRRGNNNTPCERPRNSQAALLCDNDMDNDKRHQSIKPCTTTSSSERQKRNEFYPMYAHLIQQHGSDVQNVIADNGI